MKEQSVKKKKKVQEGKSKILYETDNEELYILEFKDSAVTLYGTKTGVVKEKSKINNQISSHFFSYLESYHVPTHFVKPFSGNSMVIKKLEMIPVEVFMRNYAAGNMVKKYGVEEGKELDHPVLEYYLKGDEKQDPMVNEHHIVAFEYATAEELKQIERLAKKTNAVLKSFFYRRNIVLVEFKLKFGRNKSGKITLADEISPDTCRLWNIESEDKLNKKKFMPGKDKAIEAYEEVLSRVFKSS
ncbi:MAG: phosphoribosylaminoimidazolesuccinocarboxamide synthase [bacterium]